MRPQQNILTSQGSRFLHVQRGRFHARTHEFVRVFQALAAICSMAWSRADAGLRFFGQS